MRGKADALDDVNLQIEDANLDIGRQLNQVQSFIATGVDAIIVNAVDGDSTVALTELASGTLQTQAVCKQLNGKGKVAVMMGPLENHAAHTRTKDIEDVIASEPCKGMTIVERQVAYWSRTEAHDLMSNWLIAGVEFDTIIANNDEMAIGAIQALKSAGVKMQDVVIAGIDATPETLSNYLK